MCPTEDSRRSTPTSSAGVRYGRTDPSSAGSRRCIRAPRLGMGSTAAWPWADPTSAGGRRRRLLGRRRVGKVRHDFPGGPAHRLLGANHPDLPGRRPGARFAALAPGAYQTWVLSTSGSVHCWSSVCGNLVEVPDGTFTAVTSGWNHSCGLRTDGTVACWGDLPVVPAPEGVRGIEHPQATRPSQGGPFTAVSPETVTPAG